MEKIKIDRKAKLSLMSFSFGQTISMSYVLALLSIFYTDEMGISASMIGTIYLVARIWDAVNDPLMGILVDRVNLKRGKFIPWLRLTAWLLPLITVMLFLNPDLSLKAKTVYAFITYILWGMIYTITDVPSFAIPTVITNIESERTSVMSLRMFGAALGLVVVIPSAALVEKVGWLTLAAVYAIIMFIAMFVVRFNVREKIAYTRHRLKLRETLSYLAKNKYLLAFYLAYIILQASNLGSSLTVYFAKYNLGKLALSSVISSITMVPIIIIPLILPAMIKRFGKRKLLIFCMSGAIAFGLILYFTGYANFPVFLLLSTLRSVCGSAPIIMLGMITSDCVEYGQYTTGIRAEGLTFSVQTFSAKLAGAISGALGLYFLDAFGYVENAQQTAGTLNGIWISIALVPNLGYLAMLLIVLFLYKLKEGDVEMMIEHNQSSSGAASEQR